MTYQEQLAKVKATLEAKRKAMGDILTKSAKEGRTVTAEENSEIEAVEDEIKQLEKNAERLQGLIKAVANADNLTPVAGETPEQANASAEGDPAPQNAGQSATVTPNLEKGIGLALIVKASAVAAKSKGGITTSEVLKSWNVPESVQRAAVQKATIGTTTDPTFAAGLVDYGNLTNEFVELIRQKTVVDKLAPKMRQVPFNVKIPEQTASATVGWVGEGKMKPTGNPEFKNVTMSASKVAGIVVLSDELIRFSNPKADQLVRDDLVGATAEFIDREFFDETKAETDESPASVLNGVTPITRTGTTAEAYQADMSALIAQLVGQGVSLEGAYWVMGETRAMTVSGLRDPLGRTFFEGMTLTGERVLHGLPVMVSGSVEDKIVLIVPSQILLADDGAVDFSVSNEATINMGTEAAPNMVNLFQHNLTAIRGERFIRWKKRRVAAAGYIKY